MLVGVTKLSQTNGQRHEVGKIFSLSDANTIGLAVYELKTEIQFSNLVKAIDLPAEDVKENVTVTISGWGTTIEEVSPDHLQFVKVPTVSSKICNDTYIEEGRKGITDINVCTSVKRHQGTCFGDVGDPVAVGNTLVAVALRGVPCANGFPDIHIRVFGFVNKIKKIIGK